MDARWLKDEADSMVAALDDAAEKIAVDALHGRRLVIDVYAPIRIVTIGDNQQLSAWRGATHV